MMRKFVKAVAYASLIGRCLAQDGAAPLTLSPDQETKLRAFVTSEHRTSTAVPASFQLSVGAQVPASVPLYPVAKDLRMGPYHYAIISGKTVIVDPTTRKITRVFD